MLSHREGGKKKSATPFGAADCLLMLMLSASSLFTDWQGSEAC